MCSQQAMLLCDRLSHSPDDASPTATSVFARWHDMKRVRSGHRLQASVQQDILGVWGAMEM